MTVQATLRKAATVLGRGHPEFVTKNPKQRRIRLDVDLVFRPIDGEFHRGVLKQVARKHASKQARAVSRGTVAKAITMD